MRHTFEIPIFTPCQVTCIQGEDFKTIGKEFNLTGDLDTVEAFVFKNEPYSYFIIVESNVKVPVLVHEVNHVVNSMFQDIGIKLDTDNDEVQSFMLEYITEQAIKVLKIKLK